MKLAIFGASVSAQALTHATKEVTGYAEVLRRDHATALGFSEIRQITYAGNRMSDAGLILLDQVIAYAPDICLVEPLIEDMTRGARVSDTEIDYVYQRLLAAGILPVTLLLPNPVRRVPDGWPEYKRYMAVCQSLGLPVIRMDLTGVEGVEDKFNGIHTHLEGARIYAAEVARSLRALEDPKAVLAGLPVPDGDASQVVVQSLILPEPRPETVTDITMTLTATPGVQTRIRLVQQQTIGPFSPMLDVTAHGRAPGQAEPGDAFVTEQRSVWDPYCHYARASFVTLADFNSAGHGVIDLSIARAMADPDYASCRREVPGWPAPDARCLKPLGPLALISDGPLDAKLHDFR